LVVFLILVLKARAPERRKPQMAFKQEASEAVPGPSGAKGEISKLPETPSGVRGEEKGGAADPSEPKEERPAVLPQTDPNKHPKGAAPTDPKGDAFSQLSEALRNRGSPPGGVPKRTESAQPGSNVPAAPVREDTKPGRRKSSPAVDSSPSPSPRTGQKKKGDDLPDVALQIPEDVRPELRALLKAQALALSSRSARERIKAASVLGELGEQGAPARGLLCRAMLDPSPVVRVAAADALKSIDPKIHFLAVALMADRAAASDLNKRLEVLKKVRELKEDGWPLSPLVATDARGLALIARERTPQERLLVADLECLGAIARKDLAAARIITSELASQSPVVRRAALVALRDMKHGRLAVRHIIPMLRVEGDANRAAAVETLAALADESNEEIVAAAIAGQRYHDSETVRRAVELALNKIRGKGVLRDNKDK